MPDTMIDCDFLPPSTWKPPRGNLHCNFFLDDADGHIVVVLILVFPSKSLQMIAKFQSRESIVEHPKLIDHLIYSV